MPRREHDITPEPITDKPLQITFTSESPIDFGFESEPIQVDLKQEPKAIQAEPASREVQQQEEPKVIQAEPAPREVQQQEEPKVIQADPASREVQQQEKPKEPASVQRPESTLYHQDFGMRDLMILIREKSRPDQSKPRKSTMANLRGEITHVFKDSHGRLDQLEKVR
jgi:hypothetical protein